MSESLKNLRNLSVKELIEKHDKIATSTQISTRHYRDEITRREQNDYSKSIKYMTIWITIMTAIVTISPIINLFIIF